MNTPYQIFLHLLDSEGRLIAGNAMGPFNNLSPTVSCFFGEKIDMKNLCRKSRPVDDPYEVWQNGHGWTWHVLKKYQNPDNEAKNQYARWFVAAKSPLTYGSWEYGDTYVSEIKEYGVRTDIDIDD